jgi:hypothetical protein
MRNSLPDSIWGRSLAAEEFRAWGHDFNAQGMLANNQGQSDGCLRLPRGISSPTRQSPHLIRSSMGSHRHNSKLPKRKASL